MWFGAGEFFQSLDEKSWNISTENRKKGMDWKNIKEIDYQTWWLDGYGIVELEQNLDSQIVA